MRILNFKNKGGGNNLQDRPHRVVFIPKFHCKLNPVECIACYVKTYTRIHCDYIPFVELENITNHDVALDSVIVDLMRKFFGKVRVQKRKDYWKWHEEDIETLKISYWKVSKAAAESTDSYHSLMHSSDESVCSGVVKTEIICAF